MQEIKPMLKLKKPQLRQNNRYNYTPRYYEGKKITNVYDFDNKFEKYRKERNDIDFGGAWKEDRKASRTRGNRSFNRTVLYIAAILLFIFLWIIDFDLSIFK